MPRLSDSAQPAASKANLGRVGRSFTMAFDHTRDPAPAFPIRHRSSPPDCPLARFPAHIVSRQNRFSAVSIISTALPRSLPDFLRITGIRLSAEGRPRVRSTTSRPLLARHHPHRLTLTEVKGSGTRSPRPSAVTSRPARSRPRAARIVPSLGRRAEGDHAAPGNS
jgi:hypothetical protein